MNCVIVPFTKEGVVGFPHSSSIIAFLNNHDFGGLEFVSSGGQACLPPEACHYCLLIGG